MLLAFDDTDSPEGGCTTALVGPILARLGEDTLRGTPRLVRLDPACRFKTRGNAAVVLPLQRGLDPAAVLEAALGEVERHARLSPGKGAGIVVLGDAPAPEWYARAVQGPVGLAEVRRALERQHHAFLGTGRGLIGAYCAGAWRPARATYELIAYREERRLGQARRVDPASLAAVEADHPETFDCVDAATGRPVMVPRTPCPVLYGLRATDPARLREAASRIVSEPVARWTLFETNHASDDHVPDAVLTPHVVTGPPEAMRGGHVRAPVRADTVERTLLAFEPTGRLRHAVLSLWPGDTVLPVGSLVDGAVHLEKLLHVPAPRPARTPCPGCGAAMASSGAGAPRRCRRCGVRAPGRLERSPPRWHEAAVSARRHLARPLSLGLAPRVAHAASELGGPEQPNVYEGLRSLAFP